jgi:hypothetical protein
MSEEQTGTGVITSIEERTGAKGNYLRVEIDNWHYSAFIPKLFPILRENLGKGVDFGWTTSDDGRYQNLAWVKQAEAKPLQPNGNGMSKADWREKQRLDLRRDMVKYLIEGGRKLDLPPLEEAEAWFNWLWNGVRESALVPAELPPAAPSEVPPEVKAEPPSFAWHSKPKQIKGGHIPTVDNIHNLGDLYNACQMIGVGPKEAQSILGFTTIEEIGNMGEAWQEICAIRGVQPGDALGGK